MNRGRSRDWIWLSSFLLAIGASCSPLGAAVSPEQLPPAATQPVDFVRDIRPLFEQRCYRCHGTEKPKSDFSLVTRESALKGGSGGVAIVPGDSAKSPLIHYVARVVEDMEMPPPGKGDPLTAAEVGLLRAWIDQGARWDAQPAREPQPQLSFSPALRWIGVRGNSALFREHHWVRSGWDGGAENFQLKHRFTNGTTLAIGGRALQDEFRVNLALERPQWGFARFGFQQFRRYYSDRGPGYRWDAAGFSSFAPTWVELDRDLHLDVGKGWVELGLTRAPWPRLTLGYEYQFKDGDKATQQWGPVAQNIGGTNLVKHIYPATKTIREEVHLVRLDVAHDFHGVQIEDGARIEFVDLETRRRNVVSYPAGTLTPAAIAVVSEAQDQVQVANTFRAEKTFTDWLSVSAGHYYAHLDADAGFRQDTADAAGKTVGGAFWQGNGITLERDSHVVNVNGQAGLAEQLTLAGGVQSEWSRQSGYGNLNLREGDPNDPTTGLPDDLAFVQTDLDEVALEEHLQARFTRLPFTVLFADARWRQHWLGQYEQQYGGAHELLRNTDAANLWQEYRAGFQSSPWRRVSFGAQYTWRYRESDFDHLRDEAPVGVPGLGYPAFIRSRETETDGVETRVVWRPRPWLKATLGYERMTTEYMTRTDPLPGIQPVAASILAGTHDAHSYRLGLTLTPWRRVYLAGTLVYQDSQISTADHGHAGVGDYQGQVYHVLTSATWVLNNATDYLLSYAYSDADYGRAGGTVLPGIVYQRHTVQTGLRRRLRPHVTAQVQYAFYRHEEPGSPWNDYLAHGVFGTLTLAWP